MMKKITVWRALLKGECKQLGLTEASVRDLRGNAWHNKQNDKSWRFIAEDVEVPVSTGKIVVAKRQVVDFGKPLARQLETEPITDAPHVMWACPLCGEDHFTDLDPDTPMPAIWFCENSARGEMVLVQWKQE